MSSVESELQAFKMIFWQILDHVDEVISCFVQRLLRFYFQLLIYSSFKVRLETDNRHKSGLRESQCGAGSDSSALSRHAGQRSLQHLKADPGSVFIWHETGGHLLIGMDIVSEVA